MTCETTIGEVTLPPGDGWMPPTAAGGTVPTIERSGRLEVARAINGGEWTAFLSYASPEADDLRWQGGQLDRRPPAFAELLWSMAGSSRHVVQRVPIPAAGVAVRCARPPRVRVGRYRTTTESLSVMAQLAPGRPSKTYVPAAAVATLQAVPDFATRLHVSSVQTAVIVWFDHNLSGIPAAGLREHAAVPPLARFYQYTSGAEAFAFEVIA